MDTKFAKKYLQSETQLVKIIRAWSNARFSEWDLADYPNQFDMFPEQLSGPLHYFTSVKISTLLKQPYMYC